MKTTERSNYNPHKVEKIPNREDWHNYYLPQLIDMYNIVNDVLNEYYPKHDKNKEKIFHNLSRLIYHCSSKHICDLSN